MASRHDDPRHDAHPADAFESLTLEDGLAFRVSRLSRKLRRQWVDDLRPYKLSPPQAAILRGLNQFPGYSLRALARVLAADPMNLKRCVDGLEEQELVRSHEVATDRRQRVLFLTPQGEALAHDVERCAREQQRRLVGSLSTSQRDEVERGIALLEQRLGVGSTGTRQSRNADEYVGEIVDTSTSNHRRDSSKEKEQ